MSFIEWEGRGYQMSVPGKTYHFPNTTFSKITDFMLTNDGVNLIEELEKYLEYDDIKYHLLQNIKSVNLQTCTCNLYCMCVYSFIYFSPQCVSVCQS